MPSILNSDDGVVSGTSGLKTTGGNDGITAFQQNGTERMRIDSSGNVGIKNSTPQGTLDVGGVGGTQPGDLLVTTGSTTARVTVGRLSGAGSDNTTFRVRNRVDQTAFYVETGNLTAQVGTTFGVGNTTPATSGAGITFPATQSASTDANTLDDYEEGTYTPTAFGASTAGSTTYLNQIGRYVKIGSLVYVQINIQVSAMTGTGALRFSLPFVVNGGDPRGVGASMSDSLDWSSGTSLTCLTINGTSNCRFFTSGDNIGWAEVQVENATWEVFINVCYTI